TWDPTRPLSVYGRSKLAGEKAVMRHLRDFYIVRTSWLYGPFGRNFVDTIHAKAQELPELKIVSDQVGTPTCTLSLSEMVADLIATGRYGVYHATDDGVTNWYDFAREICKGLDVTIKPIPTNSVLDKTTLISTIGREPQSWQESLHNYLELKKVKATAAKR
ncbi:MAG TPA: sugar nucleotide-binding protein, partial [Candidatus Melainabacteria bacterium]|nr:sugar nucleotide-binding protein [Candidatus Melainabacteria bacterium]